MLVWWKWAQEWAMNIYKTKRFLFYSFPMPEESMVSSYYCILVMGHGIFAAERNSIDQIYLYCLICHIIPYFFHAFVFKHDWL